MRRDVTTELKELRLHGMVGAWTDLTAQGDSQVGDLQVADRTLAASRAHRPGHALYQPPDEGC
jgi:hypothetical protein